ncbi:hypothetical protein POJ06DRAFT_45032 [Lipomyces tetrasporus]|uniref:Uncharacterized protein n=1 Tax=Lipomyces tetrasporus TaxID=54092 RepID=A0AAD7QMV6_9ASCO|nr:uncharacterized protein POJ06DRAFT_45032 [Lipomyces tetrasporus]KAJ8096842.1 hypothetical protein POJ06DRAFT_45032 [Lipomyces tetrasporus]
MSTISRREASGVTLIHVTSLHKISNTEAEELLSSFLDNIEQQKSIAEASTSASSLYATESGASSGIASLSNAVSQQLSRIRRDLLGLPPLLRKRKADAMEQDTSVADVEMVDADGATAQPEAADSTVLQSIDKKERKRLKKERRKEEKREKEAAKTK